MGNHIVCTIGHATRPIDQFIDLLRQNDVQCVLDIRTVPKSRHNPQFNRDTLPASLAQAGIGYSHVAGLGGLRHARADSPNGAWRNASFRGYADYMQTPEFQENVEMVVQLAQRTNCVLMCAESVPWRCHRSLVADALVVRGVAVEHIISGPKRKPHALTSFATVDGTRITYPPSPE
ncbi:MAG: repair protein [Massilia sp.]|nr:repair protein [Massilia sp.]